MEARKTLTRFDDLRRLWLVENKSAVQLMLLYPRRYQQNPALTLEPYSCCQNEVVVRVPTYLRHLASAD